MAAEVRCPGCGRGVVQARLERMERAAQAVDRQRGGDVGGAGQPLGAEQRQRRDRRRRLRAVDEREAFLRPQLDRRDAGARERARARRAPPPSSPIVACPSPISTSARCASGARSPLAPTEPRLGTSGWTRAIERLDQAVERRAAHARVALREHVRAQRHHRAHRADRQRLADAGGVAPQQVALEVAERVPRNLHFGQRAEAGVDAVDRRVAGRMAIDDGARGVDGRRGLARRARPARSRRRSRRSCSSVSGCRRG